MASTRPENGTMCISFAEATGGQVRLLAAGMVRTGLKTEEDKMAPLHICVQGCCCCCCVPPFVAPSLLPLSHNARLESNNNAQPFYAPQLAKGPLLPDFPRPTHPPKLLSPKQDASLSLHRSNSFPRSATPLAIRHQCRTPSLPLFNRIKRPLHAHPPPSSCGRSSSPRLATASSTWGDAGVCAQNLSSLGRVWSRFPSGVPDSLFADTRPGGP